MESYKSLKEINETFGATGQPTQLDKNLVAVFHPTEEKWYVFSYDQKLLAWNETMTLLDIGMITENT